LQGTTETLWMNYDIEGFQSTFPLQGTTLAIAFFSKSIFISIHVPIAGNDTALQDAVYNKDISIHVPIAGNDGRRRKSTERTYYFNPRSHCRERRSRKFVRWKADRYFNPRSHCRERPSRMPTRHTVYKFQSTFPLQGTTDAIIKKRTYFCISIHVPIAGNDA